MKLIDALKQMSLKFKEYADTKLAKNLGTDKYGQGLVVDENGDVTTDGTIILDVSSGISTESEVGVEQTINNIPINRDDFFDSDGNVKQMVKVQIRMGQNGAYEFNAISSTMTDKKTIKYIGYIVVPTSLSLGGVQIVEVSFYEEQSNFVTIRMIIDRSANIANARTPGLVLSHAVDEDLIDEYTVPVVVDETGMLLVPTYPSFENPKFTGTPTAPNPGAETNDTQIATTQWTNERIAEVIDTPLVIDIGEIEPEYNNRSQIYSNVPFDCSQFYDEQDQPLQQVKIVINQTYADGDYSITNTAIPEIYYQNYGESYRGYSFNPGNQIHMLDYMQINIKNINKEMNTVTITIDNLNTFAFGDDYGNAYQGLVRAKKKTDNDTVEVHVEDGLLYVPTYPTIPDNNVFIVTFTGNNNDGYTADKTYNEVVDQAYLRDKKIIIGVYNSEPYLFSGSGIYGDIDVAGARFCQFDPREQINDVLVLCYDNSVVNTQIGVSMESSKLMVFFETYQGNITSTATYDEIFQAYADGKNIEAMDENNTIYNISGIDDTGNVMFLAVRTTSVGLKVCQFTISSDNTITYSEKEITTSAQEKEWTLIDTLTYTAEEITGGSLTVDKSYTDLDYTEICIINNFTFASSTEEQNGVSTQGLVLNTEGFNVNINDTLVSLITLNGGITKLKYNGLYWEEDNYAFTYPDFGYYGQDYSVFLDTTEVGKCNKLGLKKWQSTETSAMVVNSPTPESMTIKIYGR